MVNYQEKEKAEPPEKERAEPPVKGKEESLG
jgi:hypothetical protein